MSSMSQRTQNRVLAVDPGYDRLGVAVMENEALLYSGCFTPKKGDFEKRIQEVHERVVTLIKKYKPDALALETLYFSKNQKTAIRVAEARGVIMLAAAKARIPLLEYSPQEVKIAVTGSGSAAKDGVIKMVSRILRLSPKKRLDDEYDAIALAIAHQAQAVFHTL